MKTWDISSFQAPPEWTQIRGACWWATASPVSMQSTGGTSLKLTASPTAAESHSLCCDQCRHCAGDRVWRDSYTLLSLLLFEGCWFFKLHWAWPFYLSTYVQGPFPSVCSRISKPTFISSKNRMVIFSKSQTHAFLNLWPFEDLLCSLDVIFHFSFFLPQLWTNSIFFKVPVTAVLHLSCDFLFSAFVAAHRIVDCLELCSHVLSFHCQTPAACSVASQQTQWRGCVLLLNRNPKKCHSYSDCRPHQTAHMLKARHHKLAFNHCCWDQPDMRDNWLSSHHGHLEHLGLLSPLRR